MFSEKSRLSFIFTFFLCIFQTDNTLCHNAESVKSGIKSYVSNKLFDHIEMAALFGTYALFSAHEWGFCMRGTFLSDDKKQIIREKFCSEEPISSFFYTFNHQILAEAGLKNAEEFMILPQSRPATILNTAISNGILWTSLDVDDALIALEKYLKEINQDPAEVLFSIDELINLYNKGDELPEETAAAIVFLMTHRGILFHEVGHYVHQDVLRLGQAKKLLIKTASFAAVSTLYYYFQQAYGSRWLSKKLKENNYSVDVSREHLSNFLNIHFLTLFCSIGMHIKVANKCLGIFSRRKEKNADIYAFERISREELKLLIGLWKVIDTEFTHDLKEAIAFVNNFNNKPFWYFESRYFAFLENGLCKNEILCHAHLLAKHFLKNTNGIQYINLPKNLSENDPSLRSLFFETHPDHRDRASHAEEVYERRFGATDLKKEISTAVVAA